MSWFSNRNIIFGPLVNLKFIVKMASVHFRNIVDSTAEEAGYDAGDLLIMYVEKKDTVRQNMERYEAVLEATAVAYDEDKQEGIVHEIGMRVISAVAENCTDIFGADESNPFDDDDRHHEQSMVAAIFLDILLETKIIELVPEEQDSEEDGEGSEDYED
jgi:hypothetical protein